LPNSALYEDEMLNEMLDSMEGWIFLTSPVTASLEGSENPVFVEMQIGYFVHIYQKLNNSWEVTDLWEK
jgi:hypothetical protein